MKLDILLKHESEKNHTNIRIFDKKNKLIKTHGTIKDNELLKKEIQNKVYSYIFFNKPLLFSINNMYYYSVILFNDGIILYGPIYSPHLIRLQNDFNFTLNISNKLKLKENNLIDYFDSILLINNILNDVEITFDDFIYNNFFNENLNSKIIKRMNQIRYEFNELNREHDSLEAEKRLINAVQSGDVKLISNASIENIKGNHGTVSNDQLQNDKMLAVVGITIASRAAIGVGISREIILTLTDTYIQEINNAKDATQIESIVFNCNIHLTKIVKDYLNTNIDINENVSDYYSKKAKFYISNHLHSPLRIKEIANELKITPNYLSNLFKQSEGVTLTDYILNEKISLAKNMLLYSDANNLQIASTLSFSSQSHFCKVFRKYSNMTPVEYRKNLK